MCDKAVAANESRAARRTRNFPRELGVGRVDEHREYRAQEDAARRRREVEFRTEVAVCGKISENSRRKNTNALSTDRSRERAFGVCRKPSGRSSLIASLGRGFPSSVHVAHANELRKGRFHVDGHERSTHFVEFPIGARARGVGLE